MGDETSGGWWLSPWPASVVAAGKVSRSGMHDDGGSLYWCESRPDQGGRQVVVRAGAGRPPADVSPEGVSVRSRVHEYGGGAATVAGDALYYVDQADQQWYRSELEGSRDPRALTTAPPAGAGRSRFADGRLTASGRWLLSVEEWLVDGTTSHRLVAVPTGGDGPAVAVAEGRDFYAAPRRPPTAGG